MDNDILAVSAASDMSDSRTESKKQFLFPTKEIHDSLFGVLDDIIKAAVESVGSVLEKTINGSYFDEGSEENNSVPDLSSRANEFVTRIISRAHVQIKNDQVMPKIEKMQLSLLSTVVSWLFVPEIEVSQETLSAWCEQVLRKPNTLREKYVSEILKVFWSEVTLSDLNQRFREEFYQHVPSFVRGKDVSSISTKLLYKLLGSEFRKFGNNNV
jgi:hypothetical protein